jgi:arylsulfate sulfotransferase
MTHSILLRLSLTLALPAMLLTGCDSSPPADSGTSTPPVAQAPVATAPVENSGPAISDLNIVPNPNPTVPLAAILSLSTDTATRITLNLDDGKRQWSVTPSDEMVTGHTIPVIGMKAGRSHSITVTAEDAQGNTSTSSSVTFETPPLPEAFPRPRAMVLNQDKMEPGVTLFNINGRWGPDGKSDPVPFSPAIIVDSEGEILWYYLPSDHKVHDIKRISNGNFIYEIWPGTGGMVEIDVLGNVVQRWHFTGSNKNPVEGSTPIAHDSIHHDVLELPSGNFLVMSTELRVIEDWYTSATDPDAPRAPGNVVGDVLIEMSRDGTVLREWKLLDMFDPFRITYHSLRANYYHEHYPDAEGPVYDWSHGNAIKYIEEDNAVVMSVPYQAAVIKIDLGSGELVWILGTHDNWKAPWSEKLLTPVGEFEWSYAHHEISLSGEDTYLLFDNGVFRAVPFGEKMALEDSYTRAVEYKVDEEAMTVSQSWTYGPDDEHFYARYLGDVDRHAQTGNVLITIGAQETDAEGNSAPPSTAQRWARLVEVTHTQPAEKVWELRFQDDDLGWSIYRSERIPGVYP